MCSRRVGGVIALIVAVTCGPTVLAQTTPKIESLFPAGARRGTEVEVQLQGEYMPGLCRLTLAGEGIRLEKVVSPQRFVFKIAADAKVGPREVRLSSTQGGSPPFPFVVGDLPEMIRPDSLKPVDLKWPVTVNGRLASAGDVDEYLLPLTAGQQIICAATARAFRSPLEVTLRLLDPQRQPVATSFAHRSAEALLVHRAKTAGQYILQVYDFQMTGGTQHVYRLAVTDGPWLSHAFPAGLPQNVETPLTLYGWNLPSENGTSLVHRVPPQPAGLHDFSLPGGANRLTLPVGENAEVLEIEPNDFSDKPQSIAVATTVNGRLHQPGDVDLYAFAASKGDRLVIEADSSDLQFPTDLVLSLLNEAGKTLLEVDDNKTSRDPSLRYTIPADGKYLVSLRDRSQHGGDECIYRLHVSRVRPDLTARVNTPSLTLQSGATANLAVIVDRVEGLAGDFELTAVDLPPGITVKPQPVPTKTPATIQLPLTVADKQAPVAGLVRIVVRGTKPEDTFERVALIAETPAATTGSRGLWLAVSPEVPFTLKTTTTILDAPRMAAFPFPVSIQRKEGFTGAVRLVGVEPDRRGTVVPLEGQIAADSDTGSIPLVIQHSVTEGTTHRCRVMGVAEVLGADGKPYAVFHVAPGSMSMGCQPSPLTMTVEPAVVTWRPGESVRVEVRLMRRVPMQPITLKLNPPRGSTGLTCDTVLVREDQNVATLTLNVSQGAELPARTTVEILAESAREGLPIYGKALFRLESR